LDQTFHSKSAAAEPTTPIGLAVQWNAVCPVAPDGLGVFLTVRPYGFTPKRQNPSQTVKIPISFSPAKCSGFCSGIKGDSIHFQTTILNREEKADVPKTIDFIDD